MALSASLARHSMIFPTLLMTEKPKRGLPLFPPGADSLLSTLFAINFTIGATTTRILPARCVLTSVVCFLFFPYSLFLSLKE